jgi:hypothetical protein
MQEDAKELLAVSSQMHKCILRRGGVGWSGGGRWEWKLKEQLSAV